MNVQFQISRNNTIYEESSFREAIDRYKRDFVDKNRAIGTIGTDRTGMILLEHVSHIVKSIEFDKNDNLIGEIQFLDTPNGNVIKDIVEKGTSPQYSMSYTMKDDKIQEIFQISILPPTLNYEK